MEINDELVTYLSDLARIDFDPGSLQEIKKDLGRMIEFVDKLNQLDTSGVIPLIHMSDEMNIYRKDEVRGSVTREEALKNAASHDPFFFKVPRVIKT